MIGPRKENIMSYCVNCGVELDRSLKECPLCNTPVMNPRELNIEPEASPYPARKGQVEAVKRKDLGILITVVLTATAATCLLLNLLVFNASLWSLIVIGSCLCLFVFAFHGYPSLIHEFTYKRKNKNLHVRGYIEEGTITTPFDMRVLNNIDRYHLVLTALQNLTCLGNRSAALAQQMRDKLVEHKQYIAKYGVDLPEVSEWKWTPAAEKC